MDLSGWIVFPALVAFIVAFGLFVAYSAWRQISAVTAGFEAVFAPPRELVVEVREAIRWTQMEASDNVVFDILPTQRSPEEVLRRLSLELREAQSRPIADAVQLCYAIEWNRLGFFHVVSTQLVDREIGDRPTGEADRFLDRTALHLTILILKQQLEEAEIELEAVERTETVDVQQPSRRPAPDPSVQAPSTFAFLLEPEQHDAFMAVDPPWPPGIPDR